MEDKLIKLLEEVKEFRKELLKELEEPTLNSECIPSDRATRAFIDILNDLEEGKSMSEAFNRHIRSYEDALASCLKEGAKADEQFMHEYTQNYIHHVLMTVSHLILLDDAIQNKDNLEFIKNKIIECLDYMNRL